MTVDGPVGLWVTGIPSPPPRLNNAPVAGYEGDVGSKTTMRLFYPESAHFNPKVENNPDTLLVLVAFKAMDFHWIETILSDKKRVSEILSAKRLATGQGSAVGHRLSQGLTLHNVRPMVPKSPRGEGVNSVSCGASEKPSRQPGPQSFPEAGGTPSVRLLGQGNCQDTGLPGRNP